MPFTLPLMTAVFMVFLVTGAALPTIPLHIDGDLGFGAFEVGLASGAQFAAALISRIWAGSFSDDKGPKAAVFVGLAMGAVSGACYLISLALVDAPMTSLSVLIIGRAILGGAEAFIMIGAQAWALALSEPSRAGKVIGGIGTAMFVGLAAGAPLGSVIYAVSGFMGIGIATLVAPLLTYGLVSLLPAVRPRQRSEGGTWEVLSAVWLPGIGMACASLGYGAMTAFAVLLFDQRAWEPAWLSFTAFAVSLVAARLLLGSLPDRWGGGRTTMVFVFVQAVGMALVAFAPSALLGFAGAALTGMGYSLVYPGLALEAMRRAPIERRGSVMGLYTAFIDVSLGLLTPLLGLLASGWGLGSAFYVGAVLALCTLPIAAFATRSKGQEGL